MWPGLSKRLYQHLMLSTLHTEPITAGDALLLLQMCKYATANYAHLQPDNRHEVACVRELTQACALLQDNKDPSDRAVAWTLQVLLANAQRLGTVITCDSSRYCSPRGKCMEMQLGARSTPCTFLLHVSAFSTM